MSDRREARRQLGAAAVVSEAEAVALLPFRDSTARDWLRARGLVRTDNELGDYVLWGEVLDVLRYGGPQESPPPPAQTLARAGKQPRQRR